MVCGFTPFARLTHVGNTVHMAWLSEYPMRCDFFLNICLFTLALNSKNRRKTVNFTVGDEPETVFPLLKWIAQWRIRAGGVLTALCTHYPLDRAIGAPTIKHQFHFWFSTVPNRLAYFIVKMLPKTWTFNLWVIDCTHIRKWIMENGRTSVKPMNKTCGMTPQRHVYPTVTACATLTVPPLLSKKNYWLIYGTSVWH